MLIPVVLSGPPAHLMGTAAIEQLQQALKSLAQVRSRPAIDPGPITGVVDDALMVSLNAALGILAEELPSYVYLPLQAAMIAGATTAYAKGLVTQYAPQLTIAVNTATTKYRMSHPSTPAAPTAPTTLPTTTNAFAELFSAGWYKKPWGIALILLGAFGVYKLFIAPPKAKA